MQSSSLSKWKLRITRLCHEVLDPSLHAHTELDPTEELTQSVDLNPSWTLQSLAHLSSSADTSAESKELIDIIHEIRTLALTLVRRFIARSPSDDEREKIWDIVPVAIQRDVQISLLDCIRQITQRPESGGSEKNSLCKTIAHVYELDASRGHGWPQFDSCLQELVSQEANWSTRELYYTIAYENPAMFGDAPLPELMGNLRLGLQAISTANLSISPIEAAIAVLQVVDRALQMIDLLPLILDVLPRLATPEAQDTLGAALIAFLEIFNAKYCSELLSPYISSFLPFVISLLSRQYSNEIRNTGMEIIASTAEMMPPALQSGSSHLTQQIVTTLLSIMEEVPGEADDTAFWEADVTDEECEEQEPYIVAEDTLDRITNSLGAQYVLPSAFEMIPAMHSSSEWKKRYATMSAIGTLAEGSVKEFTEKIADIMKLVLPLLAESNPRLVYAAIYCIAEMCSYLQSIVQDQYGDTILTAFQRILSEQSAPPRLVAYTCAALVNYAEGLEPIPASLQAHSVPLFQLLHTLIVRDGGRQDVLVKAMSALSQLAGVLAVAETFSESIYKPTMTALWRIVDGVVDNYVRSRAMDCATIFALSVDAETLTPDAMRMITSLLHIQQTHTDADDPCVAQVLVSLVRLVEVLGEICLPYVDAFIPALLTRANQKADHYMTDVEEDDEYDERWLVSTSAEGQEMRVYTDVLREKTQAVQLLSSLALSLGSALTQVGSNETTTGDWTSYAETMLQLSSGLLAYEYDEEIRIAAASMLSPLVRGFKISTRHTEGYNTQIIGTIVPPLLTALAYEEQSEALSMLFEATSEIVIAAPEVFTATDAAMFVDAVREQIEGLKKQAQELRENQSENSTSAEFTTQASRSTLEYISQALQAFIKTTRFDFPIQGIFHIFSIAMHEGLEIPGEKEWALKLAADLIEFASPSAMAWTAGFLGSVKDGIGSNGDDPTTRGIASANANDKILSSDASASILLVRPKPYQKGRDTVDGSLLIACIPLLRTCLMEKPGDTEEMAVLAYDNAISAIAKVLTIDLSGTNNVNDLIVIWLKSLPIRLDKEEMEPCYSFLLHLVAQEHPIINPLDPSQCQITLHAFQSALSNPNLPKVLYEPLVVGLRAYLSKTPPAVQHEWIHPFPL